MLQEGLDEHLRGKGAKAFHANFLELWDKVSADVEVTSTMQAGSCLVVECHCSRLMIARVVATFAVCLTLPQSAWRQVVRKAATAEILFDAFMLEKVIHVVITMSWCVAESDLPSTSGHRSCYIPMLACYLCSMDVCHTVSLALNH